MALVDAAGAVIEFLSYEGTHTATDGPAAGMTSTDLGVFEPSTTPVGRSLQRRPDGLSWAPAAPNSFGACFGQPPEAPEIGAQVPVAALDGPYAAYAMDPVAMSAAASTDGDGDALTYAWDLGDGTATSGVAVSHTYATPGDYAVRLIVADPLGLADTVTTTATITAMPAAVGMERLQVLLDELVASGALTGGVTNALQAKLDAAARQFANGNHAPVRGQLGAFGNHLGALVDSGRLTAAQAAPLLAMLERVLAALGG
jgi:hypothetical protein